MFACLCSFGGFYGPFVAPEILFTYFTIQPNPGIILSHDNLNVTNLNPNLSLNLNHNITIFRFTYQRIILITKG